MVAARVPIRADAVLAYIPTTGAAVTGSRPASKDVGPFFCQIYIRKIGQNIASRPFLKRLVRSLECLQRNCACAQVKKARAALHESVDVASIPQDDSWFRDTGEGFAKPFFVLVAVLSGCFRKASKGPVDVCTFKTGPYTELKKLQHARFSAKLLCINM